MSLNQIIIIHIVRIKGRIIIFSKLTNLLRKINTFRPLTKDEVQTIEKNEAHFNDQDDQHLMNAMKKDVFWFNQDKWNDSIPTIIITEKYRMSEYERSEYFNQNSESKIIPMGTFHYIQWEYPHEIADILISLSK